MDKIKLMNVDTRQEVACLYNPAEYTITKTADYDVSKQTGKDMGPSKFSGGNPRQLQMELFFDVYETENADVRDNVTPLWDLIYVNDDKKAGQTGRGRPPRIQIVWGRNHLSTSSDKITWVMTNLQVRYTLFRDNGVPVRAVATVSMQEAIDNGRQPGQNPTSHTDPGLRTRVVEMHDTLPWIAYQEFGDAGLWRSIAQANRITDPMRLEAGRVLTIPRI
jgi:hypothetical protein